MDERSVSKEVKKQITKYCLAGLSGLPNVELRGQGPGWFMLSVQNEHGWPIFYKVKVTEQAG